jgi:hypothetical protein
MERRHHANSPTKIQSVLQGGSERRLGSYEKEKAHKQQVQEEQNRRMRAGQSRGDHHLALHLQKRLGEANPKSKERKYR